MNQLLKQAQRALSDLMIQRPFYAVTGLRLAIREDASIPTLCTNGDWLKINPSYWETLSRTHRATAIAHEVLHCVLGHPWRIAGRQANRWLMAIDYEVNGLLSQEGFSLHEQWIHDAQYHGMSAERIYHLLPDDTSGHGPGGTCGDGPDGGCRHGGCVGSSEDAKAKDAWENAAKQAGTMLGGESLAIKAIPSNTNWRELLRTHLTSRGATDYTMRRPSRRYIQHGLYLPSLISETTDVDLIVDTSGSVVYRPSLFGLFIGELDAIHSELGGHTRVIYADVDVTGEETYGPGESISDVAKPIGGGGTKFQPAIRHARAGACNPIVYLTDGEGDFGEETESVIWCMPERVTAPWGITVNILEEV